MSSFFKSSISSFYLSSFWSFLGRKVKICVIDFKTFLFHTKTRFIRASFADPNCFDWYTFLCSSSLGIANSALLYLGTRLPPFRSFSSCWPVVSSCKPYVVYCPVRGFPNLGEFKSRFDIASSRKCRKISFPP